MPLWLFIGAMVDEHRIRRLRGARARVAARSRLSHLSPNLKAWQLDVDKGLATSRHVVVHKSTPQSRARAVTFCVKSSFGIAPSQLSTMGLGVLDDHTLDHVPGMFRRRSAGILSPPRRKGRLN